MARMNRTERDRYPRLAEFLSRALPAAFSDERKRNALLCWSSIGSRAKLENALTRFTTNPKVEVGELGLDGGGYAALGMFDPTFPSSVWLAADIAAQFECDADRSDAQECVEATILHEIVHWADFIDGEQKPGDPGARFELQAYGTLHGRWFQDPSAVHDTVSAGDHFLFPITGQIGGGSSYWGDGIRDGGARSHSGIDIFNDIGTEVFAIGDGEVIGGDRYRRGARCLAEVGGYGQMIDIDHGNGLLSRYAHLQTVDVSPGPVQRGTRLGTLGASGTEWGRWVLDGRPGQTPPPEATRPHLHFEIRRSDADPFEFKGSEDPGKWFLFLGEGRAVRNTPVVALSPSKSLGVPVPPVVAPADSEVGAEWGANFVPAFPSTTFSLSDPRGLRNNNPGNIRRNATDWAGLRAADFQLDPDFFQFIAMEWGIRAMARILKNYRRVHRISTLRAVSHRWAPENGGNDPEQHAAKRARIQPGPRHLDRHGNRFVGAQYLIRRLPWHHGSGERSKGRQDFRRYRIDGYRSRASHLDARSVSGCGNPQLLLRFTEGWWLKMPG